MSEREQAAALRLADNLENLEATGSGGDYFVLTEWSQRRALEAASELRRLDAENKALMNLLRRAQPAQAVPLLTDQEIDSVWDAIPQTQFWWRRYARAVEQAVRAKRGVAVPMTDQQIDEVLQSPSLWLLNPTSEGVFRAGARWAEKTHGIVGKEGA